MSWGRVRTPGLRNKSEFEDGSVIATSLTYTTRLVNTPPAANNTTVGDIKADIDLFCDGALDRLGLSNISKQTDPNFRAVVEAGPNPAAYPDFGYGENLITGIELGGGPAVPLPNPTTLSFNTFKPAFSPVASNTIATLAVVGGDPVPPSIPLCLQGPQRATTNSPGTCGAGVPPITACAASSATVCGTQAPGTGCNPYTNPATGFVLYWSLYIGGADYFDGLVQFGPTGGTNERSGIAVPANTLRNVQCTEIAGAPDCPIGAALWTDGDGDGLPNLVETEWGSDPTKADSDTTCHGVGGFVGDGVTDFEEMAAMSNPLEIDTDGDGSCYNGTTVTNSNRTDGSDNCPNIDNDATTARPSDANQADTDMDGVGNACDIDDDQDAIIDDADDEVYMAFINDINPDPTTVTPGLNCRAWSEIAGGNVALDITSAEADALKITLDPLTDDDDGDGIIDGHECSLGSAPGNDAGGTLEGVCVGSTPAGAPCAGSVKFAGPKGVLATISASGATSRPELQDGAVADEDGDGNSNNSVDPDADGLPRSHERSERTFCVRIAGPASYAKPLFSDCGPAGAGEFNNNLDGDLLVSAIADADPNSDCDDAWGAAVGPPPDPNDCLGSQVCVWTAAAGYTADTFGTGAAGGAGCDGPEYMIGRSPSSTNEDADGQSRIEEFGDSVRCEPRDGLRRRGIHQRLLVGGRSGERHERRLPA